MRREVKHRLRELKLILEYPVNNAKLPESLESLINDIDLSTYKLGKVPDFSEKKPIKQTIVEEEMKDEDLKADKILTEVDKIMRTKKLLAETEGLTSLVPNPKNPKKPFKPSQEWDGRTKIKKESVSPSNAMPMHSPNAYDASPDALEVKKFKLKEATKPPQRFNRKHSLAEAPKEPTESEYLLTKVVLEHVENFEKDQIPTPSKRREHLHPLYKEYIRLLREELPRYQKVETEKDSKPYIEGFLGMLTLDYLRRMKGYSRQNRHHPANQPKSEFKGLSSYQYKSDERIQDIKQKLYEKRQ